MEILMENKELKEILTLVEYLSEYNQRVAQIFEFTFEKIREDGKDPFVVENNELIKYMKKRYSGVINE